MSPYTIVYVVEETGRPMILCTHAQDPDDAIAKAEAQEARNHDRPMRLRITRVRSGYHFGDLFPK